MSLLEDLKRLVRWPSLIFTAKPASIRAGEPVTLTWDAARVRADEVIITSREGEIVYRGVPTGSLVVSPRQSTWFQLVATGQAVHEEGIVHVTVGNRGNQSQPLGTASVAESPSKPAGDGDDPVRPPPVDRAVSRRRRWSRMKH